MIHTGSQMECGACREAIKQWQQEQAENVFYCLRCAKEAGLNVDKEECV